MRLTPQELDKLRLHQAGFLAQKRLARGLHLNYPEAVALIATQILEAIRDGHTVAELMDWGKRLLGRRQVMDGVPEMIDQVQVEGTFPDGSKLVTVHHPIASDDGELELALYGSFLPVPKLDLFSKGRELANTNELVPDYAQTLPGAYLLLDDDIELNSGRATTTLSVQNTGDRPIQVGSHYAFVETNRALVFDRGRSVGMRLDIPAGTAVRFEPGDIKTVKLVEFAGKGLVYGGNNLTDGPFRGTRDEILARAIARGFGHKAAVKS